MFVDVGVKSVVVILKASTNTLVFETESAVVEILFAFK